MGLGLKRSFSLQLSARADLQRLAAGLVGIGVLSTLPILNLRRLQAIPLHFSVGHTSNNPRIEQLR